MSRYTQGTLKNQGKTKLVFVALNEWNEQAKEGPDELVILRSKPDITAGDGARHEIMKGKDAIANATTVYLFKLLETCGIPVAFEQRLDETAFVARLCDMLPLEVVVRRSKHGSYLLRDPGSKKGDPFSRLHVQFYLKTTGKKWGEMELPCDDPLISFHEPDADGMCRITLHHPKKTDAEAGGPIVVAGTDAETEELPRFSHRQLRDVAHIAADAFLVLEKAWQPLNHEMVDFKLEFGLTTSGELVVGDVVDADSFRLVGPDGKYLDKQPFRDGASVKDVFPGYVRIREMASTFHVPEEAFILWRASERDDTSPFRSAWEDLGLPTSWLHEETSSAHKETELVLRRAAELVHRHPRALVGAYVGRSNGLGPVLAGNTPFPVWSVCASVEKHPEDVWSSLRMPSNLPHATILDPRNAVLFALRIFARSNPLAALLLAHQQGGYYEVESLPSAA